MKTRGRIVPLGVFLNRVEETLGELLSICKWVPADVAGSTTVSAFVSPVHGEDRNGTKSENLGWIVCHSHVSDSQWN